mmetsp:Transcript_3907/g.11337  ORF Transcript_3907/g.11337 Transcript_3907/m.11337 type:complete len:236 (-) Transcript_3907:1315-2022(-)
MSSCRIRGLARVRIRVAISPTPGAMSSVTEALAAISDRSAGLLMLTALCSSLNRSSLATSLLVISRCSSSVLPICLSDVRVDRPWTSWDMLPSETWLVGCLSVASRAALIRPSSWPACCSTAGAAARLCRRSHPRLSSTPPALRKELLANWAAEAVSPSNGDGPPVASHPAGKDSSRSNSSSSGARAAELWSSRLPCRRPRARASFDRSSQPMACVPSGAGIACGSAERAFFGLC